MNRHFHTAAYRILWIGAGLLLSVLRIAAADSDDTPVPVRPSAAETVPAPPAAGLDQTNAYYYYLCAVDQSARTNFTKAEENFRKSLESEPRSAGLRVEFARLLIQVQNFQEAHAQLEEALKLDPDQKDAHKLLAGLYNSSLGEGFSSDFRFQDLLKKTMHEYEEVLRLDASDTDSLFALGRLLLKVGQLAEAEGYLRRYVEKSDQPIDGIYYLTLVYMESKKYDQALESVSRMEADRPDSLQIKLLKADVLEKLGRGGEAEQIYTRLLETGASDPAVYLNYARLLLQQDKLDLAMAVLQKARDNSVVSSEILDLLAQLHRDRLDYDLAIQTFKDAITLDPTVIEYRYQLGLTYQRMGDSAAAIPIFTGLLKDTEKTGGQYSPSELRYRRIFLLNLGYLFVETRKLQSALAIFTKIRDEFPDEKDPAVYLQLSDLYRDLTQTQQAQAVIEEGLKKLPGNPRLESARAMLQLQAGQDPAMIAELEKRLAQNAPEDTTFHQGLAALYAEAKQWDQAIRVIDLGLGKFPGNPALLFQKGSLLERAGQPKPAENVFLDLLKADPDNSSALNYLGYMLIDSGTDCASGLRYVRQALKFEPKNPAFLDSLGWGLYKTKEYKKALDCLSQAVAVLPDDPTILDHLGDVYAALGKVHEARDCYEKSAALEKDPALKLKITEKIGKLRPRLH